ncbi:hypothetical protein [Sphaerothrix gracilis]|uniref:hypothetical protein n=1 Tax=Sphaerothrix gracilis TaxID=3151835 RepID=UPI0031FE1215
MTPIPPLSAPAGYRSQAQDTGIETDLLCFYLLRQKTVAQRLQMGTQLMRSARQLAINCFQQRFSELTPPQFKRKLAEAWLQEYCPADYVPGGSEVTWIQDSIQLAAELHHLLTHAAIPYYVTGGVATIAYGETRTTQDINVVLAVSGEAIAALATRLEQAGFYVPGVDEVASGRMQTLQVTQIDTISRADLIIAEDSAYERLKFERRQAYTLENDATLYLASPEDLVMTKLRWGQGRQSEKQWRDVLGILKAQQAQLDYDYMHRWAAEFSLSEALSQATVAAGVKAIADRQWAIAVFPVVSQAWTIALSRQRVQLLSAGQQQAEGQLYVLVQNDAEQTFSVLAKAAAREVVRYGFQGAVLSADPWLSDQQAWRAIARRLAED